MPFEEVERYALVVNVKTAHALGLTAHRHCCYERIR